MSGGWAGERDGPGRRQPGIRQGPVIRSTARHRKVGLLSVAGLRKKEEQLGSL